MEFKRILFHKNMVLFLFVVYFINIGFFLKDSSKKLQNESFDFFETSNIFKETTINYLGKDVNPAIEYLLYITLPVQSKFRFLSVINLLNYLNPTATLVTYENINLFSAAVNRFILFHISLGVLTIACISGLIICASRIRPAYLKSRFHVFLEKIISRVVLLYKKPLKIYPWQEWKSIRY